MFKGAQFSTLRSMLHVQVSKILHSALLHLGPWAPGWPDFGNYKSCIFKGAQFSTLRYFLHVQVSNILHLAPLHLRPWAPGRPDLGNYVSL